MPFLVANYVYARSQGQRTHSARTNSAQYQTTKVAQEDTCEYNATDIQGGDDVPWNDTTDYEDDEQCHSTCIGKN